VHDISKKQKEKKTNLYKHILSLLFISTINFKANTKKLNNIAKCLPVPMKTKTIEREKKIYFPYIFLFLSFQLAL
jgi:hypothetical protein